MSERRVLADRREGGGASEDDRAEVPRLRGLSDVGWWLVIVAAMAAITWMLVGHLRDEFEAWRLANALAVEVTESDRLRHQERQLRVELEVRGTEESLPVLGERFGLAPAPAERVFRLEVSP